MKKISILPIILLTGMLTSTVWDAKAAPLKEGTVIVEKKWYHTLNPLAKLAGKVSVAIAGPFLKLVGLEKTLKASKEVIRITNEIANETKVPLKNRNFKKINMLLLSYTKAANMARDDALKVAKISVKASLLPMRLTPIVKNIKIKYKGKKIKLPDAIEEVSTNLIDKIFKGLDYSQKVINYLTKMLNKQNKKIESQKKELEKAKGQLKIKPQLMNENENIHNRILEPKIETGTIRKL